MKQKLFGSGNWTKAKPCVCGHNKSLHLNKGCVYTFGMQNYCLICSCLHYEEAKR